MKLKRAKILFLSLVCLMGPAISAGATTLSFTDSSASRWPGNDVTYTLDFTFVGGSTFNATFTIENS